MSSEFGSCDRGNSRSSTARRVKLASGLTVATVVAVAGAMWAGTTAQATASRLSATTAATTTTGTNGAGPTDTGRATEGQRVDISGPDGLPTSPVTVTKGGDLVVHLKERAGSTGHSWSVSINGSGLELTGDVVAPAPVPQPGAAGEHIFTFHAKRSGPATLTFDLARPWEHEPARTVSVTVVVGKGNPHPAPLASTVDVYGPDKLPTAPVEVDTGNTLAVHLTEQAGSTGYSWSPADVPDNLSLTGESFVAGSAMPGSVGQHIFTFRVNGAGQTTLTFKLARPWEHEPASKISLTVLSRR